MTHYLTDLSVSQAQFWPVLPPDLGGLPETPLVSVLVANYNYANYLREALLSVLKQSYQHIEVIVCDDGSADESKTIIEECRHDDPRVVPIFQSNAGVAAALNHAFSVSKGEIISILDADDLFLQHKIENVVAALKSDSRAGLCVDRVQPINKIRKAIGSPLPRRAASGWIAPEFVCSGLTVELPPASGLSFRREIALQVFPVPDVFRKGTDDYLRKAALLLSGVTVAPGVQTLYRIHGTNITVCSHIDIPALEQKRVHLKHLVRFLNDLLDRTPWLPVSERLHVEHFNEYWAILVAIECLKRHREHCRKDLVSHVHGRARRWSSLVLLLFPHTIRRTLLALWWGSWVARHRVEAAGASLCAFAKPLFRLPNRGRAAGCLGNGSRSPNHFRSDSPSSSGRL